MTTMLIGVAAVIPSVSVDEYLAMRQYFVDVVRLARAIDRDVPSPASRRLLATADHFLNSVVGVLGLDHGQMLAQVEAARRQGRTHCDLLVEPDQTLDLTGVLLRFLQAVEELRAKCPTLVPPPPRGVRGFILACQEPLLQAAPDTRRRLRA